MIPREFIYAGAIILWVIGVCWVLFSECYDEKSTEEVKQGGCIVGSILLILITLVVYLLAAGAMRYAV